ncbi:MAG: Hpt domain-containing protein [Alphaproteobacteria bacterium]|nr:Hpt domain-containing protein [Alphaproteobacteria bacterium]
MVDPVIDLESLDLSNLREITGGDVELERELFLVFIKCGEESIATLSGMCADGDSPDWKEHSHSLKGEAANLGAVRLATICQASQMACAATADEKRAILEKIKQEWTIVVGYLKRILEPGS